MSGDSKQAVIYQADSDDEFDKLIKDRNYFEMKRGKMNYDIESLEIDEDLTMTLKDKIVLEGTKIGIDTSLMADDILKYLKNLKEDGYEHVPYSALNAYGKIDKLICEQSQINEQVIATRRQLHQTKELSESAIRKTDYMHQIITRHHYCIITAIIISLIALVISNVVAVISYILYSAV